MSEKSTEELTKAAQQALEAWQLREALRRVQYEAVSLADAQVIALEALTQGVANDNSAAQAGEREAFEAWAEANVQSDYSRSDRHCMWWGWQARASLTAPQQATPEPVGETWGWAIEDKHGVAQAIRPARKEFFGCVQSSEPFTAEDVSKMDCEWAGLAPHRIVTLFTHPAPGVPEGFALVPVEPTPEMKSAGIKVEVYSEVSDSIGVLTWGEVRAIYRAMLAAAQAKGGAA